MAWNVVATLIKNDPHDPERITSCIYEAVSGPHRINLLNWQEDEVVRTRLDAAEKDELQRLMQRFRCIFVPTP